MMSPPGKSDSKAFLYIMNMGAILHTQLDSLLTLDKGSWISSLHFAEEVCDGNNTVLQ